MPYIKVFSFQYLLFLCSLQKIRRHMQRIQQAHEQEQQQQEAERQRQAAEQQQQQNPGGEVSASA